MADGRRGRRLSPAERREQILDAAARLAAGRSLERVPTAELAEAAGVSQGLVFHYFPSRAELQLAVLDRSADRLIAAIDPMPDSPPVERLLAALSAYVVHVEENPESWRVLLRAGEDEGALATMARIEDAALGLLLGALGSDPAHAPAPLLLAARGWLAYEKEACAGWLDAGGSAALSRDALVGVLSGALLGAVQALAAADPPSAELLKPLLF